MKRRHLLVLALALLAGLAIGAAQAKGDVEPMGPGWYRCLVYAYSDNWEELDGSEFNIYYRCNGVGSYDLVIGSPFDIDCDGHTLEADVSRYCTSFIDWKVELVSPNWGNECDDYQLTFTDFWMEIKRDYTPGTGSPTPFYIVYSSD